MPNYTCKLCNFQTTNKKNYTGHIITKKHQKKVQDATRAQPGLSTVSPRDASPKIYTCNLFDVGFKRLCNLSRHKKICINTIQADTITNNEVINLKKENDSLKKQNDIYQKQLEIFTDLLKTKMAPTNVNNLTYVINNYGAAPELKQLESYTHIHNAKTMSISEVLIMYWQQGTLCKFIGDFLVNEYAKKNGDKQSMWTSDTSRFTYIINELQETGKIKWTMDKKGIKVKKYIVTPLLEYLRKKLESYVDDNSMKSDTHILIKLKVIIELFNIIDKEILADDIIRYIAPYFCLLKEDDDVKQIKI